MIHCYRSSREENQASVQTQHKTCQAGSWLAGVPYLIVHQDVHDIVIHLLGNLSFRPPGNEHKFNAKERDQDEGSSHGFHVKIGLRLVSNFQLGDENAYNI